MSSFNLILWFLEILDVIINNEYCKSFAVIMIFTVIVNLLPQIMLILYSMALLISTVSPQTYCHKCFQWIIIFHSNCESFPLNSFAK